MLILLLGILTFGSMGRDHLLQPRAAIRGTFKLGSDLTNLGFHLVCVILVLKAFIPLQPSWGDEFDPMLLAVWGSRLKLTAGCAFSVMAANLWGSFPPPPPREETTFHRFTLKPDAPCCYHFILDILVCFIHLLKCGHKRADSIWSLFCFWKSKQTWDWEV